LLVGVRLRFIELEPACVRRIAFYFCAFKRALRFVFAVAVKVDGVAADVIERRIWNDANASLRRFACQALEIRIGTEVRVDIFEVGSVVFVVARRLENRRHVNRIGTEVGNVIELVDNARKVTAKEIIVVNIIGAVARLGAVRFIKPVLMKLHAVILIRGHTRFRVVAFIAIAKAFGEDVVIDNVLRPRGYDKVFGENGMTKAANGFARCRFFFDRAKAIAAFFARPINGFAIVLIDECFAGNDCFKVITINANAIKTVRATPAPALIPTPNLDRFGQRQAGNLGVFENILITFQAAFFDHEHG
jgi:hypothetical protein